MQNVSSIGRGVTRLDGARGKKQVWGPHVRTWGLSEANVLHLRKYLRRYWTFWCPSQSFRAPRSDSAPRELCPPCPPRYAPASNLMLVEVLVAKVPVHFLSPFFPFYLSIFFIFSLSLVSFLSPGRNGPFSLDSCCLFKRNTKSTTKPPHNPTRNY